MLAAGGNGTRLSGRVVDLSEEVWDPEKDVASDGSLAPTRSRDPPIISVENAQAAHGNATFLNLRRQVCEQWVPGTVQPPSDSRAPVCVWRPAFMTRKQKHCEAAAATRLY